MNLKEIKEILKLMKENELSEVEVEREGSRLKMKKFGSDVQMAPVYHQPPLVSASAPGISSAAEESAAPVAKATNTVEITSPMVGTFYRAPSPESPAYADVGQVIEIGQVVCIIEAMKLMNEIKAEVRGKVVEILVNNAEPVEFGQPLFLIEPA